MTNIGSWLSRERKARKVSMRAASRLSGLSRTHIYRIEDGKHIPRTDTVARLVAAYGADLDEAMSAIRDDISEAMAERDA